MENYKEVNNNDYNNNMYCGYIDNSLYCSPILTPIDNSMLINNLDENVTNFYSENVTNFYSENSETYYQNDIFNSNETELYNGGIFDMKAKNNNSTIQSETSGACFPASTNEKSFTDLFPTCSSYSTSIDCINNDNCKWNETMPGNTNVGIISNKANKLNKECQAECQAEQRAFVGVSASIFLLWQLKLLMNKRNDEQASMRERDARLDIQSLSGMAWNSVVKPISGIGSKIPELASEFLGGDQNPLQVVISEDGVFVRL